MKQRYPIFTLVVLFVLGSFSAFAQRTVSGRVTDTGGNGMPGVNVIVKGTSVGTTTDATGRYNISMDDDATTLVFSFIGYTTQEIEVANRTSIDVSMTDDTRQLSEVVVTALGVERDKKALQYSLTEVSGDEFTQARENSLGAQLSGRIAGVNVSKAATGPAGSTRIVIRGNKSLNGQNQPLYVVDGIPMDNSNFGQAGIWGGRDQGDGLTSISPNDIESITVLKGASAAALYGSRGGNGVINIVTKKGSKRKGLGIEFNSNYVVETINDLTDLQKTFGSGNYQNGIPAKPSTVKEAWDWAGSSWGTRMDGSMVPTFDGTMRPYSYAGNNVKKFYEAGNAWTNSIALTGGGENQTFRVSVADLRSDGVVPNSGFDRLNATLSVNSKFGEKLTLDGKIMYSNEQALNRPIVSDSPGNAIQAVWQTAPSLDVEWFKGDPNKLGAIPLGMDPALLLMYGGGLAKDMKFAGQELLPWNNIYLQNPYWAAYQYNYTDTRDRILTSGQLRYDITDFLYVSGRVGMDQYTRKDHNLTPEGTGHNLPGSLSERTTNVREVNMEWILGFNKVFGSLGVNTFVGGSRMRRSYEQIAANGTGFNVQFFPAINNAKARNYGYGFNESGINSLFASAEIDFKSLVFLTATARNDWFSVLNPEYNNILYPSVGASFIFSDAFQSLPSWLTFGKVRASWAQVGLATIGPYSSNLTYSLSGDSHLGRPLATFSSAFSNNGNIPNPTLQPALSTELEFGIDIRMFDNKLGLDLTYYDQTTTDDILAATISRTSGFGSTNVNVGKLNNKGIEILLTATPVRGPLTWDVSFNVARNRNMVVSLIEGVTELVQEEPRTRNVFVKHIEGYPYGMITGKKQLLSPNGEPVYVSSVLTDPVTGLIVRDGNGNPVVTADGRPQSDAKLVPLGNGIADWTGGLNNSFTWKGFNASFLIDFKAGGDILSGTNMRLTSWGLHQQSLIGREGEDPLMVDGVVRVPRTVYDPVTNKDVAVQDESGQQVYDYRPFTDAVYDSDPTEVTNYVQHTGTLTPGQAKNYWSSVQGEGNPIPEMFMYDASFIKLRQVTIGYSFPRGLLSKTPFQNVTLSFVGRNLAILMKNIDNVDPESAYSTNAGAQGLEYFSLPPTRSYGFNLRVGF